MTTRADRKADYQAYRAAAKRLTGNDVLPESPTVSYTQVLSTAGVSLCEDGAFVDAVIWVPRRVMEEAKQ